MSEDANDGLTMEQIVPISPVQTPMSEEARAQESVRNRTGERMRELIDAVVQGGDLAEVCRLVAAWVGTAAVVTTVDGRVRALRQEREGAIAALPCFDPTGRFRVESEPAGTDRSTEDGSLHWGNLMIDGATVSEDGMGRTQALGRIVAFGQVELDADGFRLLEHAAAAAALVITREQAVKAVESKYRTDFVLEVLRGRSTSKDRVLPHAAALGWDLDRPISVVVAEIDSDTDTAAEENKRMMQTLFADAWTKTVGQYDPQAAVVGSGDQVILLLGSEDRERLTRRVDELISSVRGLGGGGRRKFSVGISRPACEVPALPHAYQEAMRALEVGRQLARGQGLKHYDSLGVYRLLLQVGEKAELRSFAEEVLGPLAGDAKEEYASLRDTLQELLDHNLNVAETARALFFHYNTLRYRIGKLEQMVGPFTSDPDLRLSLALALQIVKLP